MRWDWARLPPVMERSLRDDVKAALLILLGGVTGYLVLGADDPDVLLGGVIGLVLMIVVLNVVRRVRAHRKSRQT